MKLRRLHGLRARLMLLVGLASCPLFAVVGYDSLVQREASLAAAQRDAQNLAEAAALEQQLIFGHTRELLVSLARMPELYQDRALRDCKALGADLLKRFPYYANFGLIDPSGMVACSALPFKGPVSLADRDYFIHARDYWEFALGRYQMGRITGKPTVNAAYPLTDNDRLSYVAYLAIDLSWLNGLLSRIQLPADSDVALIDNQGTVLAAYPPDAVEIGKPLPDFAALQAALARGAGIVTSTNSDRPAAQPRITLLHPLGGSPGHSAFLVLAIPEQQLYAEANAKLIQRSVWLVLMVIAVLVAAWFASDWLILRRLRRLNRAAIQLGLGDLSARSGLAPTADELGTLSSSFDHMAARLQLQEKNLQHNIDELDNVNRALHLLSAGNRALLHSQEEAALLQAMCRVAVEKGRYHMAWVGYCTDTEDKAVVPMACAGGVSDYLERVRISWGDNELGHGPVGRAVRTRQPCVVSDTHTDPTFGPWRKAAEQNGYRSIIALPLEVGDKVLGVLAIYASEPHVFSPEEMDLLTETAADLAFGIATIRLRADHEKAQAALVESAFHDTVTDLPNRAALNRHIDELLAVAAEPRTPFALMVTDVNRLHEFNEAFGYEEGDKLLRKLGQRLQHAVADDGMVARIGEDEFAVLLPACGEDGAHAAARDLLRTLGEPFDVSGLAIDVRTAIGIALCPEHGNSADLLLRHANKAMSDAQRNGTDYLVYDGSEDRDCARRLMLIGELRRAMEYPPQLLLLGQPQISLQTGRPVGAELLLRWQHPQRGTVPPGEFIALAERTGLIKPLTYWVLEEALRACVALRREKLETRLAVNLSVYNLRDAKLLERIDEACRRWGVAAENIQLELTESALMDDPEHAMSVLRSLRERGFELHIDDFGTGYSSLSYLQKLPVSVIKIDQSFVKDMDVNPNSATIVRSTIELAHSLNLRVIAEGVETRLIQDQLQALSCDMAQGYEIARPMPLDQLAAWLAER